MVQALCLSCRNEVLALEHGGLDPLTDQPQRTYFEMALVFFGYASLLAQKSRATFSTNRSQLERFMTYTAECVCFEM